MSAAKIVKSSEPIANDDIDFENFDEEFNGEEVVNIDDMLGQEEESNPISLDNEETIEEPAPKKPEPVEPAPVEKPASRRSRASRIVYDDGEDESVAPAPVVAAPEAPKAEEVVVTEKPAPRLGGKRRFRVTDEDEAVEETKPKAATVAEPPKGNVPSDKFASLMAKKNKIEEPKAETSVAAPSSSFSALMAKKAKADPHKKYLDLVEKNGVLSAIQEMFPDEKTVMSYSKEEFEKILSNISYIMGTQSHSSTEKDELFEVSVVDPKTKKPSTVEFARLDSGSCFCIKTESPLAVGEIVAVSGSDFISGEPFDLVTFSLIAEFKNSDFIAIHEAFCLALSYRHD